MNRSRKSGWVALTIVLIFLGGWEAAVRIFEVPVYILPSPSRTFETLAANPEMYLQASALTLGESLAGLLIGVLAGGLLAVLLTLNAAAIWIRYRSQREPRW